MEDFTNILNAEDDFNEEQMMNYVTGKSSDEEAYEMEKKMANSAFINDAVEGLQQYSSSSQINTTIQQLNQDLKAKLVTKNTRSKKIVSNLKWEIIAVIAIILLCVLGFVIIQMIHK